MSIIIGGSGSTGSTLLKAILYRHQDIFIGPELSLFNKEQIFENWNKHKGKLLGKNRFLAFTTKGWFPYPETNLLHHEYGWDRKELVKIISDASSFKEFVNRFFEKPMKNHNATIWVEKTPSNCYSFPYFLDHFKEGKVIHTTRNPLDVVASLIKRGFSSIFAFGMWIYNTASALRVENSTNYFFLKYESLIQNPIKCIMSLLPFIKARADASILKMGKDTDTKCFVNPVWKNSPTDEISTKSIGSFYELDEKTQSEIVTSLATFQISKRHVRTKDMKQKNCQEVCDKLGYTFEPHIDHYFKRKIERDFRRLFLLRTIKLYSTGGYNFPARLEWHM